MDASVSRLVNLTISNTRKLLERRAVSWSVARRGVLLVIRELARKHPRCQQEIKQAFEEFVTENDNLNRINKSSSSEALFIEQVESDGATKLIQVRRHKRVTANAMEENVSYGERIYPARIISVSKSGIGLEASIKPPIGSSVVVGEAAVTVVRHLENGFAGTFDKPTGEHS